MVIRRHNVPECHAIGRTCFHESLTVEVNMSDASSCLCLWTAHGRFSRQQYDTKVSRNLNGTIWTGADGQWLPILWPSILIQANSMQARLTPIGTTSSTRYGRDILRSARLTRACISCWKPEQAVRHSQHAVLRWMTSPLTFSRRDEGDGMSQ